MALEKPGTVKSQEEVAKIMGISDSEVSRLEEKAMNKLSAVTMNSENTHLIAHKPTIQEIDNCFHSLPWCKFIEAPIRNGSRYNCRQIISRIEWTKSLTLGEKNYYINETYTIT